MTEAPRPAAADAGGDGLSERIRDSLRRVIDPELGYNIVDLGLIYEVSVTAPGVVEVVMTTTTQGCPATSYLMEGTRDATESTAGVTEVTVTLTHEPPWTPAMMSPPAKEHFGVPEGGGW